MKFAVVYIAELARGHINACRVVVPDARGLLPDWTVKFATQEHRDLPPKTHLGAVTGGQPCGDAFWIFELAGCWALSGVGVGEREEAHGADQEGLDSAAGTVAIARVASES